MKDGISTELSWQLAQFVARLFSGKFRDAEALAVALDRLSDAAWAEAEEMSPPTS